MRRILRRVTGVTAACWPISAGCTTARDLAPPPPPAEARPLTPARLAAKLVVPASYQEIAPAPSRVSLPAGDSTLTIDAVVKTVLERNPTIAQMTAAAAAAGARHQQVTSLDDPMVGVSTAPGSIGSPHADFANRIELTQKLPYPGKRDAKGRVALAEATAAGEDVAEARIQLVEAARTAFADYGQAVAAAGVVEENLGVLKDLRRNAESAYRNGIVPQQYMIQADVELARVEERGVAVRRARAVATARLNVLMHDPPGRTLPPPGDAPRYSPLPTPEELLTNALNNRPDLKAFAARVAADEAAVSVADRDYKPDVELLAAYDGFWQDASGRPLQWQVGARVNLPVRRVKRDGALAEAHAKLAQRQAERDRLIDQIGFQVREAYEQVRESEDVVLLYEGKLLPAAVTNVKEAQSAYANAKVPFLTLVEAQRNLFAVKERLIEVRADVVRRRATLDRAVGDR